MQEGKAIQYRPQLHHHSLANFASFRPLETVEPSGRRVARAGGEVIG